MRSFPKLSFGRFSKIACAAVPVWSALQASASAQVLAQSGTMKTVAGWGLTLLLIVLGLVVVLRPSGRNARDKKKKHLPPPQ